EEWNRPERAVRDIAGVLESAGEWKDDGDNGPGVYGKIRIFETHKKLITEMHKYVGMSIRAYCMAEWVENAMGGYYDVTEFDEVVSVDVVTHAGRGGAILHALESARKNSLRTTEGAVSSAPAVHKEGNKHMDPELQKALEAMNTAIASIPATV